MDYLANNLAGDKPLPVTLVAWCGACGEACCMQAHLLGFSWPSFVRGVLLLGACGEDQACECTGAVFGVWGSPVPA